MKADKFSFKKRLLWTNGHHSIFFVTNINALTLFESIKLYRQFHEFPMGLFMWQWEKILKRIGTIRHYIMWC